MFPDTSNEKYRAATQGFAPDSNAVRLLETLKSQASSVITNFDALIPTAARDLAYRISDCIESMAVRDGGLKDESVLEMVEALGLTLNRETGNGYSVTLHTGSLKADSNNPGSLKFLFVPIGEILPAHEHGSSDTACFAGEAMVTLHGTLEFVGDGKLDANDGIRLRPSQWVDVHKPQSASWAGLVYEPGVTSNPPEDIDHCKSLFWTI